MNKMGVEMRGGLGTGHGHRINWTMFIAIAACILLLLQLWTATAKTNMLREHLALESQSIVQCHEDKETLQSKMDTCHASLHNCDREKDSLQQTLREAREDRVQILKQSGASKQDLTRCNVELDSLKQLDITKTNTMNSIRLEKDTLVAKLEEARKKIASLEKELADKSKASAVTVPTKKEESADPAALASIDMGPANGGNHENAANEDMDDGDLAVPRPDV